MPKSKTIQINPEILPESLQLRLRVEQAKAGLPPYLGKKMYQTFFSECSLFEGLDVDQLIDLRKRATNVLNGRTMREDIVEAFESWAESHKSGEAA